MVSNEFSLQISWNKFYSFPLNSKPKIFVHHRENTEAVIEDQKHLAFPSRLIGLISLHIIYIINFRDSQAIK